MDVESKIFMSRITINFTCVGQNFTAIVYIPVMGLEKCNMDKVEINFISPSKDGSEFCVASVGTSGPRG